MRNRIKLFSAVAVAFSALAMTGPASAQNYGYGDRFNDGYGRYETRDRYAARDERLMDEVEQLRSEVEARRNLLRNSFFISQMRNLERMENDIRRARYAGGLTDTQYRNNRNLLDRLERRFNNELSTARGYYDYDDRYASRW